MSTAPRKRRQAPAPRAAARPQARASGPLAYVAAAVVSLIPCFWQARIQAGDLSSHLYNAWLAQLIGQGKAPGLSIVPQYTNVLFDWLLSGLFYAFGAAAAERIAVAAAVLIFTSGAFAFCRTAGGRAWTAAPILLALAYGWAFHVGFFNFYLGLGLCFWAMAVAWELRPRGLAAAGALLAVALVAHGLPVAWAVAVLAWRGLLRRWPRYRWHLFGLALAGIAALRIGLAAATETRSSWAQIENGLGIFQLWVYGRAFAAPVAALGILWAVLLAMQARLDGLQALLDSDLFQICALTAAGIVLIPNYAALAGYQHALVFISDRMSLALAVCLCALAARAPARGWQAYAAAGVAVLFFALLYPVETILNRFEDVEDQLIAGLPEESRVVSAVEAPYTYVNALTHLVDRACIGRCYSYANYEPSSGQFRIRVTGPQRIVTAIDKDSSALQGGSYVVRPEDLPLYQIEADPRGNLHVRSLPAGAKNGLTLWMGLGR